MADGSEKQVRQRAFLFASRARAENVLADLVEAGTPVDAISLFTGAVGDDTSASPDLTDAGGSAGASLGVAAGGLGGLLAGLGLIVIPGLGPLLAVGPVAAALTGAIAGGSVGGFAGALSGLGISEAEAALAEEHVREGKTILLLAGEMASSCAATIKRYGGVPI